MRDQLLIKRKQIESNIENLESLLAKEETKLEVIDEMLEETEEQAKVSKEEQLQKEYDDYKAAGGLSSFVDWKQANNK